MPTISIGTTGELGILLAGISFGVAMTVKVIKWVNEMIKARNGSGKKFDVDNLTRMQHDTICQEVKMNFDQGFKDLRDDVKTLGEQRSSEVRMIFKEIKANHTEVRDLFLQQGQRIASMESSVDSLQKHVDKLEVKVDKYGR